MRYCFALLFLLLLQITGIAQPGFNFKFITYTTNEGLVHNFTKRCLQDSKGFLWIITQHGLSRFDGYAFKNFEHSLTDSTSLPANDLADIAIDNYDRIWLAYQNGLCYFDQNTQRFIIIKVNGRPLTSNVILFDRTRNYIWSADYNAYTSIDCNTLRISSNNFIEKENEYGGMNPLYLDSRDRLWVLYGRMGYHCIDLKTNFQYYHKETVAPTAVYEDNEHRIWMATWQKGFREVINQPGKAHTFISHIDPFMVFAENGLDYISNAITSSEKLTGRDILWVIKNTDGVLLFDKRQQKFIQKISYDPNNKNGIPTDFIEWIYTDKNENLWFCTWHGIAKINKEEQQFNSRELPELRGQLYNAISGIADDPWNKNIYWVSAVGSGILKYDAGTHTIKEHFFYYYNDQAKKIYGTADENYDWRWTVNLWMDSIKQIWSTTYAGLIRIKNGRVFKMPMFSDKNEIPYLRYSSLIGNSIWALGDNGFFKVNPVHYNYTYYSDINNQKNIYFDIDSLDALHHVLATQKGIMKFNKINGQLSPLVSGADSFSKNTFCIERIGNSLFAGNDNGLWEYDIVTGKIIKIGIEQNIDKVDESSLKKDAYQNLWVYTSHGLFRYNVPKKQFEEFTTDDGIYDLSNDAINFFSYNNSFYLGYRMAVTKFDPASVNINLKKITPFITELFINNQPFAIAPDSFRFKKLMLEYDENEIRINYTAPDFTNANKINFKYRLKGLDTNWIDVYARRTAIFSNLPSGNYSFEVITANSSGLWNNEPAVFNFMIKTPFWRTAWFKILLASLVLALIYLLYRYRLRQLKKIYEVRSNISRSLHDEVGATLSSINIYSDVARSKNNDPAIGQLIDKVYDASANAMENMSDIVWYVNPVNDLVENLVVRMREYALPLLEAKDINVIFETEQHIEALKTNMQQRQNVYLIFKEAINNALKYAEAKNIHIMLEKEENNVILKISDDGKGFAATNEFSGNGIKNMNFRAKAVSGSLHINSSEGKGTVIHLHFPIA